MSVTVAKGFRAFGIASGIKSSGAPDLALVASASGQPVVAAGVFTSNLVQAAPVQISKRHLRSGVATAVILNSGNANAATGEAGLRDALRMCELTAAGLRCAADDVLVCSTGLIGIPMSMTPVEQGIPKLTQLLREDAAGSDAAADAILTTDTVRKTAVATVELGGGLVGTVGGIAKGAAMLAPAMATMLAVITTDVAIDQSALKAALELAIDKSFNQISVDGCTSTNDTVLVLSSGAVKNRALSAGGAAFHAFAAALTGVCSSLAEQMVNDAEGATKRARVVVRGARSKQDARLAVRGVANSQLVQCSLYGADPYWGRVLSELGASGARFKPERVDISYNGVLVCHEGIAAAHDESALAVSMAQREIEIVCDLGAGNDEAVILTTDLTHAYVDENMGTS